MNRNSTPVNGSIPVIWFLVALLLPASMVAAYITFSPPGTPLNHITVGETVGGMVALVALPSLLVVVWRFLQRRRGYSTNVPIAAGGILFLALALFTVMGLVASTRAATVYKPAGCDMSVTFPSEPDVRKMETEGISYEQARWTGTTTMLRAECFGVPVAISREEMAARLNLQAIVDGLQNSSITHNPDYVELRGHKNVGGVPATYVARFYRGPASVLASAVASPSADFPTTDMAAFWASVEGALPID